jgi:hypothetical protein
MARDLFAELSTETSTEIPQAPRDLFAELSKYQAPATADTPQTSAPTQPVEPQAIPAGASQALAGYQQPQTGPGGFARIKKAITGEEMSTPEIEAVPEIGMADELNSLSLDALKSSYGLLAADDTNAVKKVLEEQMGDDITFREDAKGNTIAELPSGDYALNKPGLSGQDIARSLFNVAAFAKAAGARSLLGAAAKGGATEAAIETGEAAAGGEFDPWDIPESALISGAFRGVEKVIGAGYRALTGTPKAELQEVVETGTRMGVPVKTTDVIPPGTAAGKLGQQLGEKIPVFGTGGIRETQQQARETAVQELADRYSQYSYPAIVSGLKAQKDKIKSAAGDRLGRVGKTLDNYGALPLQSTTKKIAESAGELSKKGTIKSETALQDLKTLMGALRETPQTFTTLRENLTAFREIVKGADKAERTQLTSRAKALLKNVEYAMKRDLDRFAKEKLPAREYQRWKRANEVYADEAAKMTKSRVKNVLDKGDITPETVDSMLFSRQPSEVRRLYTSLNAEGKQHARAAIIDKVMTTLGRRAGGITPQGFSSELKKLGLQTDTFFKGNEKKQLQGFIKLLDATRRAQEAPVVTQTGQQLMSLSALGAIIAAPVQTIGAGATVGGFARLYESPAVRNALIRLANSPRGSTAFDKSLTEAANAIQLGVRAAQSSNTEKRRKSK